MNSQIADKPTQKALGTNPQTLSGRQVFIVLALGVVLWLAAALCIRYTVPLGIYGGLIGIITFLVSIPISALLVFIVKGPAALDRAQIVPGIGLSVAAATLCDGVALTWTPSLYGSKPEDVLLGAALLLWGVGCILVLSYFIATLTSRSTA
jgi:hypothetical protein